MFNVHCCRTSRDRAVLGVTGRPPCWVCLPFYQYRSSPGRSILRLTVPHLTDLRDHDVADRFKRIRSDTVLPEEWMI